MTAASDPSGPSVPADAGLTAGLSAAAGTASIQPSAFDIGAALPVGRVTLEASAGTGKTYGIVGLATRFLAEGRCLSGQLLVVTFARSATRELRSRLLERLDGGIDVLDAAIAGGAAAIVGPDEDPVAAALCTSDPTVPGGGRRPADVEELQRRRDRLGDALADIDQATVTTIHGFCAETLDRLGDAGRGTLLDDEHAFATEIAGDLYLKAVAADPDAVRQLPWFDRFGPALARAGMDTPPEDVLPDATLASWDGARAWVVTQAHAEAIRRKRRARVHSHDDLLRRLADRLEDHVHGADAVLRAGGHFRVALIDEFQDTDPVQWRIVSRLFGDPTGDDGRTLVLVGDPKQAIYAFRGADVNAYVAARGDRATYRLDVNHRSDDAVVQAVQALFGQQSLGQGIRLPPVTAAADDRLHGLDAAPVTIAMVADDAPVRQTQTGRMQRPGLRDAVARDVARQTVQILTSGAAVTRQQAPQPIAAADIAVLVRTRHQARLVQHHLVRAGVPTVLNGVGNVLAAPSARDWTHVLRALDRPSQTGLARLAALSDLIGWTPARVAQAGEEDWDRLHITLHGWRSVLLRDGVAAAFRLMGADTDLAARLLGREDGDRRLTDLTHIAELLHAHLSANVVGTAGLVAWLEAGMAEAADGSRPVPPDHLASRLERGGDAVQIMTVHGAKGLEFGVVLAPYLWDVVGRAPVVMPFHDHTVGRRRLYVGSNQRNPDHQHHKALYTQEADDEERRLAYVAATRARHHLRVWWAPAEHVADSPLGALLGRSARINTTAQALEAVQALRQAHPGSFDIIDATVDAEVPSMPARPAPERTLSLAPFDRAIDAGWRRTSYSRLVNDAHAAADAAGDGAAEADTPRPLSAEAIEGEGRADVEESLASEAVPVAGQDPDLTAVVPLSDLRGGADIGSTLHSVLEHVDFAAPDLEGALRRHIDRQAVRHAVDLGEAEEQAVIAQGLAAAMRTPLGPGWPSLSQVQRGARVDELAFELPVLGPGTDDQAGRVLLGDIADLLQAHLPAEDPLAGYAAVLRRGLGTIEVRGFLAGYIDLLARVPGHEAYLVADYKTNRMAPIGVADVTVGHFTRAAMAAEMQLHHYPLQALVYLVAVHRYLRWRIEGYDPDRHLAGVAYLFLRGMVGPGTPEHDGMVCGVFRWRPPTPLLQALDRLLTDGLDPAQRTMGAGW